MLTPEPSSGYGRAPARAQASSNIRIQGDKYEVRFAQSSAELDSVLSLRYEVFNLELGEGLASSYLTERDLDEYDAVCDHLMVVERASDKVVGTYRLMTAEMALASRGFYSTGEYDLSALPHPVLADGVELGRACVSREHRNTNVLFLLWRGIAAYLGQTGKRYLFGCCSLTSQDPVEGNAVALRLEREGRVHPYLLAPVRPGYACEAPVDAGALERAAAHIPQLFSLYLRFGARVCSAPAIDRTFGTIDFLVVFDTNDMDERARKMFLPDDGGSE